MNYLELVQRYRQESNYANSGPATIVGQIGDHARAVSWIADAYTELQNRTAWRWLKKEFTLNTVASDDSYMSTDATDDDTAIAIARFKSWHIDDPYNPPRIYLQSAGIGSAYWLTYIPWAQFRTTYQIGTFADSSPSHISIDPKNNLRIGPPPSAVYVIESEYVRSAQVLAANTDIPEMPSDYHMLIIYLALQDGGFYDLAEEMIARGVKKGKKLIRQLENDQGPAIRMAGALA